MSRSLREALTRIDVAPLRRPTAAESVRSALRQQIVDGHLRPGTRLVEETIGSALGFSRNTVREALALLAAERLVVRETHRGVVVATLSSEDVRDLYAARRVIEPAALRRGPGLDVAALEGLREAVTLGQDAARGEDVQGMVSANQLFHRRVSALSGSSRVQELMEDMLAEMRLVFDVMTADRTFHPDFLHRNGQIVALLEAGDRDGAAEAMLAYLHDAEVRLLSAPVWDDRD
ncbi:GntR family transcriptional regulator [Ornithinimicrobium tianjinense]|uniref:GntR family transcriptional regulator n=1 Tax=Ornithinimicrobium tianjinense TaxID=1195761 RepID=A0A917BJK8_9MICO|nr:GntR family transcriptional regulator [Ornithinimicrobium tianjinense]GGF46412.1 GntR family transcriptional regulator [Ornithinimicrobium tianjinense]